MADYPKMAGWLIGTIKTALNYHGMSEQARQHFEEALEEVKKMETEGGQD